MAEKLEDSKAEAEGKKAADKYSYWIREITTAKRREKAFRSDGESLVEMFEGGKVDETPYNILYSNTETIAPSVYSNTPRPNVRPRFKDEKPVTAAAAKVCQRMLEFFLDSGDSEYAVFDDLMLSSVVEALVPGRGLVQFRYDAKFLEAEPPVEVAEGDNKSPEAMAQPHQEVAYETVCGEEVPWDRFLHGYAKKWKDVPWIGFWYPMDRDELVMNFGFEVGSKVPVYPSTGSDLLDDNEKQNSEDNDQKSNTKTAKVWQIWDKTSRKVVYIAEGFTDGPLKELEDPLELSGFFPIPRPLTFVSKISSLTPVALYKLYENQAKELNTVTRRISAIVRAMKVRGFYDSTIEGIEEVLKAEDNTLVPAQNVAALQQGQSLENSIWLMPLDKLIAVLQQLLAHRQQIKSVIFEIMGIADIMRGSSQASETLGAQEIKTQWGSLRLKKPQKEVHRYVRDSLRIMAEIGVNKLSIETLQGMTGLSYPREAEQQQAQVAVQQIQAMGPQAPPEAQAQVQQLQQVLSQPSWEAIMQELRSDLQRFYKIDIETNSTVDAIVTEDKQDIAEFMNAMSQFMNGIAPLIEQGIMPFEAAKAMLLAITKRYNFGIEVEEQLKSMAPPPKQEGDPKAAAEAEKIKMETQAQQQELQMKGKMQEQELALDQERLAMQREELRMKADFNRQEHAFRMQELAAKARLTQVTTDAKLQQLAAQASMPKPQPQQSKKPSGGK